MKKFRRIMALLLATVMVMSMGAVAFAAEGDHKITISNENAKGDHIFDAYQIFEGTVDEEGNLTGIKWGTNITDNGAALIAALKADVTIGTYFEKATDAATTAAGMAKITDNSDAAEKLAEIIESNVTGAPVATGTGKASVEITVSGDGYYFIKDATTTMPKEDSYSRYILKVAGEDVTAASKSDVVSSDKKVKDKNDSTGETTAWQDSADHDVGDEIEYRIAAYLPGNVSKYDTYKLNFVDTMSKGLEYVADSAEVFVGTTNENGESKGKVEPTSAPYSGEDDAYQGGTVLRWNFTDIKAATYGATDNSVVYITYKAKLTSEALAGSAGNPNEMHIEYSNNPNSGHDGETGNTPDDKNIVFTYNVEINKYADEVAEGKELTGAEFKLYKEIKDGDTLSVKEITLSTAENVFTASKIDDGKYILQETKKPDGYNLIEGKVTFNNVEYEHAVEFEVTAEHDAVADNPQLTSLTGNKTAGTIDFTLTASDDLSKLSTNVVDKSGSTLPETGGIGPTLFYIIGAIMVIGAGVVLISRRRMNVQ
ncbi:isopeptide-forming domain-containing fimbrial protein [Butyrivibrio sp.]|uniref:isopeptide-forming domain-containing fimbrial protein n=1 Tax=Butyrivibrio sp. TaxID=28121 RepID=UPI0025C3D0A7|nr:isopeptide-forming domain-containing fimbrial protein [Butyrivibrio sp.]MBQ9304272.1 isopeptide-forming domain-containing fimbrial protein [Butyrivibrio sp.]